VTFNIGPYQMLGNDREISDYTMAVTRQRPINRNRGTVFSMRPVARCYKQDELVSQLDPSSRQRGRPT
jgi:hypothetical protein